MKSIASFFILEKFSARDCEFLVSTGPRPARPDPQIFFFNFFHIFSIIPFNTSKEIDNLRVFFFLYSTTLRWYYTKEMSFFKTRQNSNILYLSDVEIIVDFSSENRIQKYHFFIEIRLFTYTQTSWSS